ncbi:MAG: aspartate kinase [Phycisphaerae bacterium]|nr:aspartate kinase [Phycisphaerae bacterium]
MSIVVMKFGGTSVSDAEKIRSAARRVVQVRNQGRQVVVVVSAMGKTTDRLVNLAGQVTRRPPKREMDQLLATGEQVTISLIAMMLESMKTPAISFTAGQIKIITDDVHTQARIRHINARRIHGELDAGRVVIIAGFQGVTEDGAVTTLGRGGSNLTLVAVAAAIGAKVCENYTDVDGVYTADPNIVPNARKIARISYDEMMELSSLGASVLHNRAVGFAKKYSVPIHVRSSLHNRKGTMIVKETEEMERIVVSGAALKKNLASVSLRNVPDRPGVAAGIFHAIAAAKIIVDDIIQIETGPKLATISFTVDLHTLPEVRRVCRKLFRQMKGTTIECEKNLAKVSVIGLGMRVHTGVAEKMFAALAEGSINIRNITTSEIKISCIIDKLDGPKALRLVHDAFDLGRKKKPVAKTPKKKIPKKKIASKKK